VSFKCALCTEGKRLFLFACSIVREAELLLRMYLADLLRAYLTMFSVSGHQRQMVVWLIVGKDLEGRSYPKRCTARNFLGGTEKSHENLGVAGNPAEISKELSRIQV
jgi:hypothetical protein